MANAIWQATIVDQSGNVLPGAEVTVVDESTGLSAPLFTTRTGTTKSNPFFADANGFAQFYAAPGLYRITAISGGTGTTMTWRYVRLIDVGTTPSQIPTNADLGTAATKDVGTAAGDVLEVGAFGLGANTLALSENDNYSGFVIGQAGLTPTMRVISSGYGIEIYAKLSSSGDLLYRTISNGARNTEKKIWTEGNTVVDGSGFIKSASPIVKLYSDKIELNDYSEIEDCTFERVNIGHYIIKGAPLLSRDGWYIETLKDRNNNIYFTLDYEELEDGLHIKTYEPDYSTGRATNGAPVDINEGRFVTLRFEEDPSLYPAPEEPVK